MMKRLAIVAGVLVVGLGIGGTYWLTQSRAQLDGAEVVQVAQGEKIQAEVYRTPTCGCCGSWVEHATKNGFVFEDNIQEDITPIKDQFGITPELASCHTAVAAGYVFEGHIPAADVQRFLANPPADVVGLTVPGMPVGSPGMEMGDRQQAYEVLALHTDGSTSVFQAYE